MSTLRTATAMLSLLACTTITLADEQVRVDQLSPGDQFQFSHWRVTVTDLDILPYVENEYTRRFRFDSYNNPKLHELRETYSLDEVVADGETEFEQQLLLMSWVNGLWQHTDPYERGLGGLRNALEILEYARQEQGFFCVQDAAVLTSAASALGWIVRPVGAPSHSWLEVWSNEHRRWVLLDPTSNFYFEKDGLPLSTYEAQRHALDGEGDTVDRINPATATSEPRRRAMGSFRSQFTILPNSDLMDSDIEHGGGFRVTEDQAHDRATRETVGDPARDLHFPVNQAALEIEPAGDALAVQIRTLTPNFDRFEVRYDDGPWQQVDERFVWAIDAGVNHLEARSVNRFGVAGPVSHVTLRAADLAERADVDRLAGGEIVIPATSFSGQGGGRVAIRPLPEAEPTYTQYWYTPGHWLAWPIEDAAAGEYRVEVTYAALFATERRLEVAGQNEPAIDAFRFSPTGNWNAFETVRLPGTVRLAEGFNTLRITCLDETSLRLSEIRLVGNGGEIVLDGAAFTAQAGGDAKRSVNAEAGYFRFFNDEGHRLTWRFDAPATGEYDVYLHYATLYNSPRELRINGEVAIASFTMPLTVNWQTWMEGKAPEPVHIEAGENTLSLTSLGGRGLNLAAIRLVGPDGREVYIPAVDFIEEEGGEVTTVRPPRNDTFYRWNDEGHWLQWDVHAPRGGEYEMVVRYATQARSPREVRINGDVVPGLASVTLEPTGNWQQWREATLPATVTLEPGRNVLRMTSLGGAGLNLDEIRFQPVR